MSYTSHGHHIPGINDDEPLRKPDAVECGGPGACIFCTRQAEALLAMEGKPGLEGKRDEVLHQAAISLSDLGINFDTAQMILDKLSEDGFEIGKRIV